MAKHKTQTRAYLDFKREVESLLYDVDPNGMGSSIDAPRDEYSDEAARLLPLLVQIADGEDAALPWEDAELQARLIELAVQYRYRMGESGDIREH